MDQREFIRSGEWAKRLAALTPAERQAFEWDRKGLKPKDLAQGTTRSPQTIWNLMTRARKKMRAAIA